MSSGDFTYEINNSEIPNSDIIDDSGSTEIVAFNNRDLIPAERTIELDNTDPTVYDDREPGSMFYGVDWYGDEVTIYDNILGIYLYKGIIRKLKVIEGQERKLVVETVNYIQNLTALCTYKNIASDLTFAETIKNILTDSDNGNLSSVLLDNRSFQRAINIQDAASAYVYINYDTSGATDANHGKKCLDVINELLRISSCHLYMYNNKIYIYQWQEWNGNIGETISTITENSYKHEFNPDDIVNSYRIVYKAGAGIAYSTDSDTSSIATYGVQSFDAPDQEIDSTDWTDFRIICKDSTSASWAGDTALARGIYMKKYFEIKLDHSYRELKLNDQIDLAFGSFIREPCRILEYEYDRKTRQIGIKGLFLNTPHEYYSRDDEAPDSIEIISLDSYYGGVIIRWTISQDADYLGYKIYFTPTRGEWEVEICNLGISPIDSKNPVVVNGLNVIAFYELSVGVEYYIKIKVYDTSYNFSDDSNVETVTITNNDDYFIMADGDYLDLSDSTHLAVFTF